MIGYGRARRFARLVAKLVTVVLLVGSASHAGAGEAINPLKKIEMAQAPKLPKIPAGQGAASTGPVKGATNASPPTTASNPSAISGTGMNRAGSNTGAVGGAAKTRVGVSGTGIRGAK